MGALADLLLQAKLAWDGKEAEEGMGGAGDSAEKMENRMGKALKKVGTALAAAFTVDKIIDFGKQCIASGAEVSAETAAFNQIMGDYAAEATKKMGAVADSAGMVDSRLTPYMTSMTAKFKGLGYGVDDATTMAARGLTLATDASAFWDMSLDDSMSHLNSFINGSYEGGEAIGLFANDTQMAAYAVQEGIVKSTKDWSALDEATKQATRLEYAENMMKQSGATGQAAKESGAYANVMANLSEKWRQFQAVIGEPLIEYIVIPVVNLLTKGIDYLSKAVDYVKEHFSEWKPRIEGVASALGILGAAFAGYKLGVLISSISKFVSGLSLAKIKTVAMTVAQKALNLVMSANPVGLVVAAIAALVAGFVVAYNKSETFRNFVNKLWASIKNFLQPAISAVGNFITGKLVPAFQKAGTWISGKLTPAFQKIGSFINGTVVPALSKLWSWLSGKIGAAVRGVAGWISGTLVPTLQSLGNYITTNIVPAVKELVSAIAARLTPVFRAISSFVTSTVVPAFKSIVTTIKNVLTKAQPILEAIKTAFTTVWNNIKTVLSTVWNNIKTIVSGGLRVIKGIITAVTSAIKGDWSGAWEAIKGVASTIWSTIKTVIGNTVNGIKGVVRNTLQGLKSICSNVWEGIKGAASAAWEGLKTTAGTVWGGIKSAITDKIEEAKTKASENWNSIKSTASTAWNSLKTTAGTLWSGIRSAITSRIASTKATASTNWNSIKTTATTVWEGIKTTASTIWNGIKSAVTSPISAARTTLSTAWGLIKTKASSTWNGIKSTATTVWNNIKSAVTNPIETAKSTLSTAVESIKGFLSFSGLSATVANVWNKIKTNITSKLKTASDTVKSIIDKIKGFFNFTFSWPSLPMPHFSITPAGWKIGDLLKGSIPKLGIEWYAKAMDQAAVLDGATIFGATEKGLLGGGEAGREVVSGEEHLIGLINQAVAQTNAAMLAVLREILEAIRGANEELYDTIVDALVDGVRFKLNDREFGRLVRAHA